MFDGKFKYILGIFLIIAVLVSVIVGIIFFKTTKFKKPPASQPSTIVGTVKNIGNEDEFTLEKDGEIVFQNKAEDLPKIKYRISYPSKVVPARWSDLELQDNVILIISYDPNGQIESRILRIYRKQAPTEQ